MTEVKIAKDIGMRRAAALANLTLDQQLDLICEGLPALRAVHVGDDEPLKPKCCSRSNGGDEPALTDAARRTNVW